MKIGFASNDWSNLVDESTNRPGWGGAGWARLGQYQNRLPFEVVAGRLAEKGGVFGVVEYYAEDGTFAKKMHFDCDVIVMQRVMNADVADKMGGAIASGQVILNDIDDWFWGVSTKNIATHGLYSDPDDNLNHYKKILSRSTAVICSTTYLQSRIAPWCRGNVEVFPNFVDLARFTPRSQRKDPVVGWAGSTMSRSGDLEQLRGKLEPVLREGLKFKHVGHADSYMHDGEIKERPTFAQMAGIPDEKVAREPLVDPSLYGGALKFDIGLVPLSDVPFNLAKSNIKGLEYTAAGIPFVASDTPEYRALHENFGIGQIVRKPKDWSKHILAMRDIETRRDMVDAATVAVRPFRIEIGALLMTALLEHYATA